MIHNRIANSSILFLLFSFLALSGCMPPEYSEEWTFACGVDNPCKAGWACHPTEHVCVSGTLSGVDTTTPDTTTPDTTTPDTTTPECQPGISSGKKTSGEHGLVWVEIPSGCFTMGCSPGDGECGNDEKPPHEVTVSAFKMLETEVTEAQYKAVTGEDPSADYNGGGGANSPVENVTWYKAKEFCEAVGGYLPSEAQWEYAGRGGTTTKYLCGDSSSCVGDIAWYDANSGNHKHDVKGKDPNGYGLYDMSGNVYEWVADCWHGSYNEAPGVAYPPWDENCSGSYRVRRGGSFDSEAVDLRMSNRGSSYPSYDDNYLGFRCARSK